MAVRINRRLLGVGALVAAIYSLAAEWLIRRPQRRYAAGVIALAVMAACLPITYYLVAAPESKSDAVANRALENEQASVLKDGDRVLPMTTGRGRGERANGRSATERLPREGATR